MNFYYLHIDIKSLTACLLIVSLHMSCDARAQAGPPFLSNDPGTPGNGNWEINLASAQTIVRGVSSYQVPQIDLNFGLGDRVQLTYQIPYIVQSSSAQPLQSGWSNAYTGVKWRFVGQGADGWQISTFPQVEIGTSLRSRQKGIAAVGPRYLLPIEVSKSLGSLDLNFEAGYYFPGRGLKERFFGLVVGRSVTKRLELDAEIYDDRVYGAANSVTLDFGGRYQLTRGINALFMAGRSVNGSADGQPQFVGYFGIQILWSSYSHSLISEQ